MSEAPNILHKGRLEALSDGVFAVVLTLLVLDLKLDHIPPHASETEIWSALRDVSGPLLGYAFSFAITAAFWVFQDRKFAFLAHATVRHAAWTFGFLFGITLIPFSVSLYLRSMQSGIGSCIYFATFGFIAAMLLGGWLDARRSGLVVTTADAGSLHRFTRRLIGMASANVIGAVVAYFQPSYAGAALVLVILLTRSLTKAPRAPAPIKAT